MAWNVEINNRNIYISKESNLNWKKENQTSYVKKYENINYAANEININIKIINNSNI